MTRISFLIYLNLMGGKIPKLVCAEIGVSKGENAIAMLTATDKIQRLILVDSYLPEDPSFTDPHGNLMLKEDADKFYQNTCKRLEPWYRKAILQRKRSVDAAKGFPDEFFHYVYIDAAHDYKSVREDMEAWYPKVKPFGMLAGHDSWHSPVAIAVTEFATKNKVTTSVVSTIPGDIRLPMIGDCEDWWMIKANNLIMWKVQM